MGKVKRVTLKKESIKEKRGDKEYWIPTLILNGQRTYLCMQGQEIRCETKEEADEWLED